MTVPVEDMDDADDESSSCGVLGTGAPVPKRSSSSSLNSGSGGGGAMAACMAVVIFALAHFFWRWLMFCGPSEEDTKLGRTRGLLGALGHMFPLG
jgi:hypothetical protein